MRRHGRVECTSVKWVVLNKNVCGEVEKERESHNQCRQCSGVRVSWGGVSAQVSWRGQLGVKMMD